MVVSFWEVLERARAGDKVEEKAFDMSIFRAAQRAIKAHGIKYDRAHPVPAEDGLADAVFQAALEFYSEIGTYCISTGRVIRFTREEIQERLAAVPTEVTLGEGRERVVLAHRQIEDPAEPVVFGGLQTMMYSDEDTMFRISKATAEDMSLDGLWGGGFFTLEGGYPVIAGTPTEIFAYRRSIEVLRRAVAAAGRPGLPIVNNAPLAAASIGMADPDKGLRPTDPFHSSGSSEMKILYDDLNRVAFGLARGGPLRGGHNAVIGGFSGSIEGAAVVCVAGAMQAVLVNQSQETRPSAVPFRVKSRALREHIWVASLALQALGRNTHMILDGSTGNHTAAGPGTKQFMYENAAGQVASTACGGHSLGGTRKFVTGSVPNYGSPLESRWLGELTKSVAGMSRSQADEIVLYLLGKYEDKLMDAPEGYPFEKLYDQASMRPVPEYQKLYDEVKEEFVGLGVNFKSWPAVG